MDAVRRHPWIVAIAGAMLLWLVFLAFPIVPETRQAVVVRFGKPERILNEYRPGHLIGSVGAGISWRIPFVDQIVWIDKRILDVDMQTQNVLSTDKRWLQVDAYARYRIVNPLLMYVRATTEDNLQVRLRYRAPLTDVQSLQKIDAAEDGQRCKHREVQHHHGWRNRNR